MVLVMVMVMVMKSLKQCQTITMLSICKNLINLIAQIAKSTLINDLRWGGNKIVPPPHNMGPLMKPANIGGFS